MKQLLLWYEGDGTLYYPSVVDDPANFRRLEIDLEPDGTVHLTPDHLAHGNNDITDMLIAAGKAKFL